MENSKICCSLGMRPLLGSNLLTNHLYVRKTLLGQLNGLLFEFQAIVLENGLSVGGESLDLQLSFWTSLTRSGCVGQLQNCFRNVSYRADDNTFWRFLDTTDQGGCLALDKINEGFHSNLENSPTFNPKFFSCSTALKFACEVDGPLSSFIQVDTALDVLGYIFTRSD